MKRKKYNLNSYFQEVYKESLTESVKESKSELIPFWKKFLATEIFNILEKAE